MTGDIVDTKKSMVIDEIAQEFIYVMLGDNTKSEVLKRYNQNNESMQCCVRRYLEEKLREL